MAVLTYKCPNCGGEVTFDPTEQNFRCDYCISHFTSKELQAASQHDTIEINEEAQKAEQREAIVYSCPSCGAQIITDETTAATFCYYCHNPVILSGKLEGKFLPDKVVPFEISKEEAINVFLSWVKSKRFVPKDFFSKEQIEKIVGIYFPYWIMDCDVDVSASGKATNSRIWMAGDLEYTETSIYEIERQGSIHFEDLNKNALKKANKKLVEGVMPFKTLQMKPFSMNYLSGFQAEKRDMEQIELQEAMDEEMKKYANILLKETVSGYSTTTMDSVTLNPKSRAWEYVLLPVWVLTYQNAGKTYYYALNGQTKKPCGELPIDYKKLIIYCGAIALMLFMVLMIGGWFIW